MASWGVLGWRGLSAAHKYKLWDTNKAQCYHSDECELLGTQKYYTEIGGALQLRGKHQRLLAISKPLPWLKHAQTNGHSIRQHQSQVTWPGCDFWWVIWWSILTGKQPTHQALKCKYTVGTRWGASGNETYWHVTHSCIHPCTHPNRRKRLNSASDKHSSHLRAAITMLITVSQFKTSPAQCNYPCFRGTKVGPST